MQIQSILKQISNRQFKPIYLLYGEETYFIDQISKALEHTVLTDAQKGFDQSILYGKETDLATVVSVAKRYPMMSDHQLVIVKEAQHLDWKSGSEFLEKYLNDPMPSTILVFEHRYTKFEKRRKVHKLAEKIGLVLEAKKLYDNQLPGWIGSYVQARGWSIDPQATMLISDHLGADLSKVTNEVDKLLMNVPKEKAISAVEVEANIGISKDFNVFELNNALSNKNWSRAVQIVDYFSENPKNHPIIRIVGGLSTHFMKILKYHYLPDKSQASVAKNLGVHPFFVKDYVTAARNYSRPQLFRVIHALQEMDLKSKGVDVGAHTSSRDIYRDFIIDIMR